MSRPKKYCSQAEFARIMAYRSRAYVTQLKQAGRLVIDEKGRVDIEASKIRIKETEDPNRDDVRSMHASKREADKPAAQKPEKKTKAKDPTQISYQDARARKEAAQAQQAEIELQKMMGQLVNKDEMKSAISDMVTTFRQELENFPHRIAAELVGKDINDIRIIVKQGVHDALHNLERGCNDKLNQQQEQAA